MSKWQEIADDLRRDIVEKKAYPVGARLPPIGKLMEKYDVPSLNTVRRAQQELVGLGLLESRQGVGVFVASTELPGTLDVLAELHAMKAMINRIINQIESDVASS